ncbi:GDP dissociation inhibitor family protein / RabGTPase activator family protein [Striga asiatica]|uniref:GDP dissociation inhibitor family protein / RabGTPase activator family protein n=1 Tax=Striga asiatica TaxID=4170 RepID=A0A5A7PGI7_STRAF|nr:GDP dissociation inhibitor family protein / RabGTPase activator family protein [Striga asiatica]
MESADDVEVRFFWTESSSLQTGGDRALLVWRTRREIGEERRRQTRGAELFLSDAINPVGHLGSQIVLPIPNHPTPEKRPVLLPGRQLPSPINLEPAQSTEAAHFENVFHNARGLLLVGEGAAEESSQAPKHRTRALLELLVPEEEKFIGGVAAFVPVTEHVVPEGPEDADPAAEHVEHVLDGGWGGALGLEGVGEVPEGDKNVLGVPAERREGHVGGQDAALVGGVKGGVGGSAVDEEADLEEGDELVGAGGGERMVVVGGERGVSGTVGEGEDEGLEPGGAGFGGGDEEDVGGEGTEMGLAGHDTLEVAGGVPEALVQVQVCDQPPLFFREF